MLKKIVKQYPYDILRQLLQSEEGSISIKKNKMTPLLCVCDGGCPRCSDSEYDQVMAAKVLAVRK